MTIKNMWKWRCFLLPEKNFLDFGCQEATFFLKHFVRFKSRSLYFITNWNCLEENSSRKLLQYFPAKCFGRWRLSRFQLSQCNGCFFGISDAQLAHRLMMQTGQICSQSSWISAKLAPGHLTLLWRGSWKLDWSFILWPLFSRDTESLKTTDFT